MTLLAWLALVTSCQKESNTPVPAAPKPSVTSVDPLAGFAGVNITVKGVNLGDVTKVSFGGAEATLVSQSNDEIDVTVPSGAISGSVTVNTWDTVIVAANFKVYQVYALVDEYLTGSSRVEVWHNGTLTFIASGDEFKESYDLFVDGTDYYVAGAQIFRAIYWKNQTPFPISNDQASKAKSIALDGGVLQIAGMEINGSQYGVKHWVDGVGTFLSTPLYDNNDYAEDMEIYEGAVYIGGSQSTSNLSCTATYWVDGVKQELSLPSETAGVFDLFIDSNGDVYAVGYLSSTPYSKVVYWKNGVIHEVTDGTSQFYGYSIFKYNNVVYIVGSGFAGTAGFGALWRNDAHEVLGGTLFANKIQVVDGDIFILCQRANANETTAVWFNGRLVNVSATEGTAYGKSLVVKNN